MISLQRLISVGALALFLFCVACSPPRDSDIRYSVVVIAFDPDSKIQSIKTIREETGLGLAEAKALIEATPSVVRAGLPQSEAEAVAARLRAKKMTVELRSES